MTMLFPFMADFEEILQGRSPAKKRPFVDINASEIDSDHVLTGDTIWEVQLRFFCHTVIPAETSDSDRAVMLRQSKHRLMEYMFRRLVHRLETLSDMTLKFRHDLQPGSNEWHNAAQLYAEINKLLREVRLDEGGSDERRRDT